jgi:stress-induced morphogen
MMPDTHKSSRHLSGRVARIHAALEAAFREAVIAIDDDSARHAGHAGAAPGGETHFKVKIVSPDFEGLNRIARHRAVNAALAAEFETGLHALNIDAQTPGGT